MAVIYGRLHPLDYLGAPLDDRIVMDRVINEAAKHVDNLARFYIGILWVGLTGKPLDWDKLKAPEPGSIPFATITEHLPTDQPPEPLTQD